MTEQWDGVPENPERDGWHWVRPTYGVGIDAPKHWLSRVERWELSDGTFAFPHECALRWRYLGPCLTPAEVAAREAASAEAMNEAWFSAVEREAERLTALGGRSIHEARALRHFAGQQRARIPHASALARALAAAEKCGMERAAKWHKEQASKHGEWRNWGGPSDRTEQMLERFHEEAAAYFSAAAKESQ